MPGHSIRITGPSGAIDWGYRRAAELGPWSYDGGWLSAVVRDADPIRLSQTPLIWIIQRGDLPPLRRYLEHVVFDGKSLTAKVGSKA